jgi:hypothetical protein
VRLANEGIGVDPEEQCIQSLSDTSVELAKALRAESLLAYGDPKVRQLSLLLGLSVIRLA